jgi:hypothetical protein
MELTQPLQISPALLPAVRIGSGPEMAWVQIDSPKRGESGLVISILMPGGKEVRSDNFHPRGDIRKAMAAALGFLAASGESYQYRISVTKKAEPDPDGNETLFPAPVPEWAYRFSDEISMAEYELENPEGTEE